MVDDWKRLAVFAEVVRAGSLSAAGRRLGISTSAVSQQLRALEQAHGVTLLHRSTRKLALTEVGARLAQQCQAMVDAAERARQQLEAARDAPEGELRIAAPVGFARHLAPALAPLLAAHPALSPRLFVDDAMIDLIDARIDLAVRAGRLADSSWAARRLCRFETVLCAAPAYLARAGMPQAPDELAAHEWIGSARDGQSMDLVLHGPAGAQAALDLQPRMLGNNQLSLQQLCMAGLGLMLAVRADIDEALRTGRLLPVMPEWRGTPLPVWAVTPQRDGQPAKVRHAAGAIGGYLQGVPGALPD